MHSIDEFESIRLYRDPVDMRKSILGLSALVLSDVEQIRSGDLFVFISRNGRRLKMIYWDKTGYALWYKSLEKARFIWPKHYQDHALAASATQLRSLLRGFDVFQKPHNNLTFKQIVC